MSITRYGTGSTAGGGQPRPFARAVADPSHRARSNPVGTERFAATMRRAETS